MRFVALPDDSPDLHAHFLDRDAERIEHARRNALLLPKQAEQEMLRADVVVAQRTRLVLREDDDLSSPLREALEHGSGARPP